MAAVDATDCAIDGTVSEANRDDGRPVRCGTPDAVITVVGGMTRPSVFAGLGVVATGSSVLGMDLVLAVAFGAAADLTGAFLAATGLVLVVDFLAGGLGVTLVAADLATGLLLCDVGGAGLATVLATAGAVLAACLAFAGVAFN